MWTAPPAESEPAAPATPGQGGSFRAAPGRAVTMADLPRGPCYEVLGKLGEGGFGVVYRALFHGEGDFQKVVAIKVLAPDMEQVDDVASRLRDEARLLGLIRHRSIVQVDRLVRLNGRWSVIMECIDGVGLHTIRKGGPMMPRTALELAMEIGAALDVAFNTPGPDGKPLRILHRDIKPSNILVTGNGEVKILDFGIARGDYATREANTEVVRFGSAGYLSPERIDGVDVAAGDVYALGAVLWEMLTGRRLGKTWANEARHERKIREAVDDLRATAHMPYPVIDLVRDMLAYRPEERPTAREVERRASELLGKAVGSTLRDWAEHVVVDLLQERTAEDDATSVAGVVLFEDRDDVSGPIVTVPTSGRPGVDGSMIAMAMGSGVALALVVVAAVMFGVVWGQNEGQTMAVVNEPQRSSGVVVVEDAEAGSLTDTTERMDGTAVVGEIKPLLPVPMKVPKKVKDQPRVPVVAAPKPPAPVVLAIPAWHEDFRKRKGRIKLEGDAVKVELFAGDKVAVPGRLAEGEWLVRATFAGRPSMDAGLVTVPANAVVTLICSAISGKCVTKGG